MRFLTHTVSSGGGRDINQDAADHVITPEMGCWVLADGLGGHGGGEQASGIATKAILQSFQAHAECSPAAIMTYIEAARNAVVKRQDEDSTLIGMRTTIVVLVCDMNTALWGHVGDSRLYYFKQGRLEKQTHDHSVPQAMVDARQIKPSDVRHHEDRNRLLRSLGGREEVRASIEEKANNIRPGDAFLLCSDGFWEYVTETAMEVDLAKSGSPSDWVRFMELRLRAAAPEDQDNYTAVAVFAAV